MGADTTAIPKKYEIIPMNMTTKNTGYRLGRRSCQQGPHSNRETGIGMGS